MLRPITLALRARDDRRNLPGMALKTLEFWVDNLTPGYLAAVLSEDGPALLTELMSALTQLLRPPPAPHGADALRTLGKLGGLNRAWLANPPRLLQVSCGAGAIACVCEGGAADGARVGWRASA